MIARSISISVCAFALLSAVAPPICAAGFADVLDSPAQMSPLATRTMAQAIARVDRSLVVVGQRGHILVSSNEGVTWKQSVVPVSSDLTAVFFTDSATGWAVGHDGVVLRTQDRGESWELQLDGRKVNNLLVSAMTQKAQAEPSSDSAKKLLAEALRYKDQGADKPFLDVWFADSRTGFVVGAYNLIFRTTDGGNTWEPWFDRTDNPKFFNLYAIRPAGGELYIAGESGLLMKLDAATQRFKALDIPYTGSLFGLADARNAILAFGLRGNVFRSEDNGASWTKVEAGLPAAVVASTRTSRGAVLLADAGGRVVASDDGGRTFNKVALKQSMPVMGLAETTEARLALVGPRGVVVTDITAR